jgi:hypothetical protein
LAIISTGEVESELPGNPEPFAFGQQVIKHFSHSLAGSCGEGVKSAIRVRLIVDGIGQGVECLKAPGKAPGETMHGWVGRLFDRDILL